MLNTISSAKTHWQVSSQLNLKSFILGTIFVLLPFCRPFFIFFYFVFLEWFCFLFLNTSNQVTCSGVFTSGAVVYLTWINFIFILFLNLVAIRGSRVNSHCDLQTTRVWTHTVAVDRHNRTFITSDHSGLTGLTHSGSLHPPEFTLLLYKLSLNM